MLRLSRLVANLNIFGKRSLGYFASTHENVPYKGNYFRPEGDAWKWCSKKWLGKIMHGRLGCSEGKPIRVILLLNGLRTPNSKVSTWELGLTSKLQRVGANRSNSAQNTSVVCKMVNDPYGSNLVQRSKDARLGNNLAFKRNYFDQADSSLFSRRNSGENKLTHTTIGWTFRLTDLK